MIVRALVILIALVALGSGIWFGQLKHGDDAPQRRAEWELPDQSGELRRAAEFDGRWQLINFWASWCAPCMEEIPLLVATQAKHPQLQILGPAMDQIEPAQAAAERMGVTYPILFGDMGVVNWMSALGDTRGALPFSVLIDPQGIIRERHWGTLQPQMLEKWLKDI